MSNLIADLIINLLVIGTSVVNFKLIQIGILPSFFLGFGWKSDTRSLYTSKTSFFNSSLFHADLFAVKAASLTLG